MQGARPCDSDGALVKPGVARAVDDVTGEIFDCNKINQYSEEMWGMLLMILLSPNLMQVCQSFVNSWFLLANMGGFHGVPVDFPWFSLKPIQWSMDFWFCLMFFCSRIASSGACQPCTVHLSHRLSSRACATNGLVFSGNSYRKTMETPIEIILNTLW